MSNIVRFYIIAFEDFEGKVSSRSVSDFLYNLNDKLNNNIQDIKKTLPDQKKIRIFSLIEDEMPKQFILPFGKLKNNVSYIEDNTQQNLRVLDYDIYDVNLMYYDGQHKVMALTQDKPGPSHKAIETYLNQFVDKSEKVQIKINPIYKTDGLEKIKKANRISKIIINFDFSKSSWGFIAQRLQCQNEQKESFLKSVKEIATGSKQIDANKLCLTLSADKNKKLDRDSLLIFLESLNIQDEFIKEIEVYYANNEKEKTTPAKLKKCNVILNDCFKSELNLTYNFLLEKNKIENYSRIQEIIRKNINDINSAVRKYFVHY